MTALFAITVELIFLTLALYCICTLLRREEKGFLILFFGLIAYGMALETTTIHLTRGYHYGYFLVMVGGVPLWIGCMWAVLVYTAMRITDLIGLPEHVKPAADAVLVASVDVAMDPVAVSLGLWNWTIPGNWFGVPYANYFGWFNAVFIFSIIWRGSEFYLRRMGAVVPRRWLPYLHVFFTVVLATIVLDISLLMYYLNLSLRIQEILLAAMFVGSAAIIALYHPRFNANNRPDWHLVMPVGTVFCLFLLGILIAGGFGVVFIVIYMLIFILSMEARLIPFFGHLLKKEGRFGQ